MKKIIFLLLIGGIISSCQQPVGNLMSKQENNNKALFKRFFDEVLNAHNVAMADSFCTADIIDHNPAPGHSGQGLDDLRAQLNELFAGTPDLHITPDFMVAKRDTVVAYITMTGTNTGPMNNMPATNKSFKINGVDIIVLNENGKATEHWGVYDLMSMMSQLGMMGGGAPPDSSMMGDKTMEMN